MKTLYRSQNASKAGITFTALALMLGLTLSSSPALAQTVNFQQGESPDNTFSHQVTYIREGQSTTNLNGEDLLVGFNGSGTARRLRAIFSYDFSEGFSPGLTFTDLELTLTVASGSSDAIVMDIFELTPGGNVENLFSESEATWNNYATGTPWSTPGGDFDSNSVLTFADSTGNTSTGDKVTFGSTSAFVSAAQAAYDEDRLFQFIIVSQTESTADLMRFDDNSSTVADRPLLTVTAIPEPGTLILVGIALGSLLLFRRRK